MKKRKKIGLALGSGGARGFCHIGVLKVFLENDIPIDFISGCSMGALVAACYSCGVSIDEMIKTATKIRQSTFYDIGVDNNGIISRSGLIRGRRAMSIAKKLIGDKAFEETLIPLRVTAADLNEGKLIVYSSGEIMPAIRASISIPALFKAPVNDKNHLIVDGGILERIPINSAKEMGADIVIAVDALGEPLQSFELGKGRAIPSVIERSYQLLDWESTQQKLKAADLVITPNQGHRSIFLFKDNEYSIAQGESAAQEALPKILELIR